MEALIVTGSDKTFSQLAGLIRSSGDYNIVRATTGAVARRAFSERDFELVIVSSPPDERGKELALSLGEMGAAGVILTEDSFIYESVAEQLEGDGIIVVPRPVSRAIMLMAIKMVAATNARVRRLRTENVTLTREIEDMRYINKAKYALMESLGYTENQAHKYIEKRAMDERKTRKAVALEVLKIYEVQETVR